MNELALFAGAGGGILGGKLLGWRTVCAVEWEPYAAGVLAARQNDKILEPFPIWDDVQTFDGKPWRGIVDVVSGGFPCQDISAAGKGAGIDGERSSMWKHMARIIGEIRPSFVFVENSPMLVSRGLAVVLADFAKMGFDAEWGVIGAHHAGFLHERERIWILAYTKGINGWNKPQNFSNGFARAGRKKFAETAENDWVDVATEFCGMDDGVAHRLDKLHAIGNGQVPRVAAAAFAILAEQLMTANDTGNGPRQAQLAEGPC